MRLEAFEMERMQSLHEHRVEINLSESGVEPLSLRELLALSPDSGAEWEALVSSASPRSSVPSRSPGSTPSRAECGAASSSARCVSRPPAGLAGELGADLAMTGVVQKVSNLILNINLYLRDVHTGQLVAAASADMRGNTDESWSRATAYVVRNRLLAPNYGGPQAR